jgi:hypothetical protein
MRRSAGEAALFNIVRPSIPFAFPREGHIIRRNMRKMLKNKFALLVLITITAVTPAISYAQNKTILHLANEYTLALKKYEALKMRTSVESVFRKGKAVSLKLDEMENLRDEDYALLEKKMRGFEINRMEIVFVVPDGKFFAALAKTHGTRADARYFALMRQVRPDNVWAAYQEQQTDVTSCTKYAGILTPLYGKALQFKRAYPASYTGYIDEEIDNIISELREGNCACGDRRSVEQEFKLFIKTFPRDKNTPAVRKRLQALKKKGYFRFNCQSG